MKKIYSSRGASRGLLIAVVTAGIWMAWAIGYSQCVDANVPRMSLNSIDDPITKEK